MRHRDTKAGRWLLPLPALLAALLAAPLPAIAQNPGGTDLAEQTGGQDEAAAERSRQSVAKAFAQSLNSKERSEWINRKSYSNDEWERAESAVKADLKACDKGDPAACKTAGDAYVSGDGVWPVPAIAYILYSQACDAGVGEGCTAFVDLAATGYGYPEGDYDEAALIERACGLGDLVACDRFANDLRTSDLARSDALLEKTCSAGGDQACLSLGTVLAASRRPEDHERAATMWDARCRQSALWACQAMAALVKDAPEHDAQLAAQYEHLSCYLEDAAHCADMGARAYLGNGVAADRDLALVYYDRACLLDQGYCKIPETLRAIPMLRGACTPDDAQACAELGRALSHALSPEYDRVAAAQLLQSGCRKGVADVCIDAAEIVRSAFSGNDPARSAAVSEMLETGCEAGNLDACFKLAEALEAGEPGAGDVNRAAALYNRLCDAGFLEGCDRAYRYPELLASDQAAPAGDGTDSRWSFETEICFTQSVIFRGRTYVHENCPRTEKGIRSNRARRAEAPWQALLWRPEILAGVRLGVTQRVGCGGTLIAAGWVLTAAHCLTDNGVNIRKAGHRIRLGVFNPQVDEGISYPILQAIPHPLYDAANKFVFDIALIRYDHRAGREGRVSDAASVQRRKMIAPASLDPLDVGERKIVTGMPVYSYGWGWTEAENSKSSNYLQIVSMAMMSEKACTAQTRFANALSDAALCVGGKNGEQMCYGDSGGPLVQYGNRGAAAVLIGVVSAGKQCGATGLPSQYTRVAKVKGWIETHIRPAR